ncbi:glycosyltransferase family 4 protein [Salinisphaera sp.]|uniref:glycosyltransferase family 4 protein n=1 Tax=Salinisphaera sp. TaxID=1914330 RepID=UPI002D79DFE7|nr:glycosyltransferase family 4 protein [Salinisphaera sp.]HET7313788.1 glycosyltransferase family 4 protein [Salinisphaera sp.]
MNILTLAPQPFMTPRGTPIAVKMLLETLSGRGDHMDVVTFAEGEDIEIANCRFFRVPALPGMRNVPPGFSLKKLVSDAVMFPMVGWRLLRNRYDLVLAVEESAYMAMLLRPIFRVPYIFDIDSSIPEQIGDKYKLPRPIARCLTAIERAAARRAIGVIACCAALGELVRGYAPKTPVQVLEDVTMLGHLPEGPLYDAARYDEPVVMYVGNLEPYQGLDLLLEAVARLDQTMTPMRLVVIGGGPSHIRAYREKAGTLGIADHVTFAGPKPVAELGMHLRSATIAASPRIQGRNTPMKVYSYLDSGRPLLATRLPTHTQVLDDEIAMLVDPNPEDVARGLRALLADSELRARIATAARSRVAAEFTPAAYRRKLNAFLDTEIIPRLNSKRAES